MAGQALEPTETASDGTVLLPPRVFKIVGQEKLGFRSSIRRDFVYTLGLNSDPKCDDAADRLDYCGLSFYFDPEETALHLELCEKVKPEIALCRIPANARVTKDHDSLLFERKQGKSSSLYVDEFISVTEFLNRYFDEAKLLAVLKTSAAPLSYVQEDLITPEMCLAAVGERGYGVLHVPESKLTPELCLKAVNKCGWVIRSLPARFITNELCVSAVSSDIGHCHLREIPKEQLSYEVCLTAVSAHGYELEDVPKEFVTPGLCLAAVNNYGGALKHVPEEFWTPEVCLAAVSRYGKAVRLLDEDQLTPELCMAAVKNNPWALVYIPNSKRTEEVCLAAFSSDTEPFDPHDDNDTSAIRVLSDEQMSPKVCVAAVTQWPAAICSIPGDKRTEEVCLAAVKQDGLIVQHLTDAQRTPRVCYEAFLQNRAACRYLSDRQCGFVADARALPQPPPPPTQA